MTNRNTKHREKQLLQMAKHSVQCKYDGAGSFTYSYRLIQNLQNKAVSTITQIKCTGCGYSLDYPKN